jgi:Na+/phosphate symporter
MDPVTLVALAIATGAVLGLKETASEVVKDTYKALKKRLLKKHGDQAEVGDAVKKVEAAPNSEARQALLKEELAKTDVANDAKLLELAKQLLAAAGQDVDQTTGQTITIVGDKSRITQVSQQAGGNATQIGVARDVTLPKK